MFVKQISIYLENLRGTLRELTKVLAENNVDIMALSIADTSNFGIVRLIVREKDIPTVMDALKKEGYIAKENSVICVAVPNQPAGFDKVLATIEGTDISIEYLYSFNYSAGDNALIILRMSDNDKAIECFSKSGIKTLSQCEINAI